MDSGSCSDTASVSSTGTSCFDERLNELSSSSDVVDVSVVDRTEGERDGADDVADVSESDSDCILCSVDGVVRRKGPFVRRLRAMIEGNALDDILP